MHMSFSSTCLNMLMALTQIGGYVENLCFFACTVLCSIGHGVRQGYASTYGAHTVAMQSFLAAFHRTYILR